MKRIFLVGSPRSGTTLLQSMLVASPSLLALPETHYFARAYPRNRLKRRLSWPALLTSRLLPEIAREAGRADLGRRHRFGPFSRAWSDAFVDLLDALAADRGCLGWLEKTPRHLHFIDEITRVVPDARFVHIQRAGAHVVSSLRAASRSHPTEWGGERSLADGVERWNHDLLLSERYRDHPHHVHVRFEALVRRPGDVLEDLCRRLEVPFASSMLRPSSQYGAVVRESEAWKANNAREIDPARATTRTGLSVPDARWVGRRLLEPLEGAASCADGGER